MTTSNALWLINARWVAVDGSRNDGPIRLENGRFFPALSGDIPVDARTMDGQGGLLFPGLVDPHVHLREPGKTYKEGIANGTLAALAGGVTTVLDMPNDQPPTTSPRRVAAKHCRFARRSRTHFGLFQQATARGPLAVAPGIVGTKVYLARSSSAAPITTVQRLRRVFAANRVVAIHAELEGYLPAAATGPHHRRRPETALMAGLALVEQALRSLAADHRPRLVLCHVTGRSELAWLRRMKDEGFDIWGETCPHYLLLDQDDAAAAGAALQVNPPLRDALDREALWAGLYDYTIDFLATDHAPHTPEDKASPQPPSGMPGLEWLGPFIVTLARAHRISWQRAVELGCTKAATCYGLTGHNGLFEDCPANLALYCERGADSRVLSRAGYCPYPDFDFLVQVAATFVDGELKYSNQRQRGELG